MAKNTQPVLKRCRTLGIEPGVMGVDKKSNRNPKPNRRKMSEYGMQLREKQKAKRYYGVLESQFRSYYEMAERRPGKTGENLLSILECRLDNVVYRLGFANSRTQARQLVRHGVFTLNGHKVTIPSLQVKVGDSVEVPEKSRTIPVLAEAQEAVARRGCPSWLEVDAPNFKGIVKALPQRDDIQFPINEHLIVELYSK